MTSRGQLVDDKRIGHCQLESSRIVFEIQIYLASKCGTVNIVIYKFEISKAH